MTGLPQKNIILSMESSQLKEFFPLLQQGVLVLTQVGCPLEQLLGQQWGLSPDYVAQRVTTIFMNSRPIDDVSTAIVREGAVIALSGAMPGLVGATMRRGGYYAAMRGGITYRETSADDHKHSAKVRVKLFNLLLPELGPVFLLQGVILTGAELSDFLESKGPSFWQGCTGALLNGTPVGQGALQSGEISPATGMVQLIVNFEEKP